MSLSPLPTGPVQPRSSEIRPASTAVERFLLPLTVSLMEVQPLSLLVALLTFLFTGRLHSVALNPIFLLALTLFLLAWAMLVEYFVHTRNVQHNTRLNLVTLCYSLSWLIALAATAYLWLPALLIGTISPLLFISVALVTWLWRRAISYARGGFDYSSLATTFKTGFGILLFILLLSLITPLGTRFLPELALFTPLFFLFGLLSLSLARLVAIRREHRASDAQSDPVRPWLIALLALTAAVSVLIILIETIFSFSSFEFLLSALAPVWNILNTIIDWLLYFLILIIVYPLFALLQFLIHLSGGNGLSNSQPLISPTRPPHFQTVTHTNDLPTPVLAVSHWLLLVVFFALVLLILWRAMARLRSVYANELVDETRESLDARALLQQRFRDWWNRRRNQRPSPDLEPLDPTSARAQYRRFLQQIAMLDSNKAKRPHETPEEYELRLCTFLEQAPQPHEQKGQAIFLIHELTRAYTQERYGSRSMSDQQRTSLPAWVDYLLVQLTGRTTIPPSRHE